VRKVTAADLLYEALAQWQWRRRGRAAAPGEGLELRKRLLPSTGAPAGEHADEPADGALGLDVWLQGMVRQRPHARVLDLGCGFGASLLRWANAGAAHCVGITRSPFQVDRATAMSAQLGLSARCTFVRADFTTAPAGPFDVVVAIEALGHAAELGAVLCSVRARLAPGGTFLWVEDLLREAPDAAADAAAAADIAKDVQTLARCWASPPLRTVAEAREALAAAGFRVVREVDLTARVPVVAMARNRRRTRLLGVLRRLAPLAAMRRCALAFLGGCALERLYSRSACSYRVWMAECPPETT
jgi:2-polyprenyl-3-methyl-5-hydroxy-6-metoxy-1,4-benzoquinol methylase